MPTWSCDQYASYSRAENGKDFASNSDFTFKDFLPHCMESGGFFKDPSYEEFGTLICAANRWLRKNRQWKIKTCESVEFKIKEDERVDVNKMTYYEHGERPTYYIRGLRLWFSEKQNDREQVQQIGFLNLIPQQVGVKGLFGSPIYETKDEVLSRFNSTPESNPLNGRVITVETQAMKISIYHGLDPDRSDWKEDRNYRKHFRFIIRIFYEVMAGSPEEIGIKDFAPDCLSEGGCCSRPDYEPFSSVVNKASDWCRQQKELRFCNVQSLEIKKRPGKDIDTQKMDYKEHGIRATFNVRILRVCYTKPPSNLNLQMDIPPSISQLTSKTFVPVMLKEGMLNDQYETLSQTKVRMKAWVRATGAQVVSAETAAVRMMTTYGPDQGTEASINGDGTGTNEQWIFVIRLYLNGIYREPPPEMLPPVPDIDSESCCIVL